MFKLSEPEAASAQVDPNEIEPLRGTGIPQPEEIALERSHQGEVSEHPDHEWLHNVYQGDSVPQLTVRAVLMGGILGSLMSISNLYTTIKVGWAFGVAITACVLSFVIWNGFRGVFRNLSQMSILENSCMQSTASAAGYSTGSTIGTAFGALLLITGQQVSWKVMILWTAVTAALGVFLAVPMKRQMINYEKLTFPDGVAAAQTLRSLYGKTKESINQARALISWLFIAMGVGFLGTGDFKWQKDLHLKFPEIPPFQVTSQGVSLAKMPGFGIEPSLLFIAAGMIIGMRVCASMFVGALILYFIVGPWIVNIGEVAPERLIKGWSLWTGTALMVTSGLTAFALQWKTIVRSFSSLKLGANKTAIEKDVAERLATIEVPFRWLVIGLVPLLIAMVALQYVAFNIHPFLGIFAVIMSFFLALVACRATGETNITPIGPMGKLTQLTYAFLAPSNITTNLMAASVTANIASSSADLLTDLKTGYLLGANARKQFLAQFIGVFFGTVAIVPAWYLMVPNREVMDRFNAPSANMWRAVAEALSHGISYIPEHARLGLLIGGGLGIVLALIDHFAPKKIKPYLPSAMGLGMSWVVPFANSFGFFLGALVAFVWSKINEKHADLYVIPVASGAVAGESLMCAIIAMITAAGGLIGPK